MLRTDASITVLVNNAGIGATAPLLDSDIDKMSRMIDLNVTALVRLTYAVVPAFVKRGSGTIINMASIVGIAPEVLNGVYGRHQSLRTGLHPLPPQGACRAATDFWDLAGNPVERLPSQIVMKADDLVDAAIAGFDIGELVTIPSLPDIADWEAYEAARQNTIPKLSLSSPAVRYGVTALDPIGGR